MRLTAFLVCAALTQSALAQESCLKQVFNRYCLGGPVSELLAEHPPLHTMQSSGKDRHIYGTKDEPIFVSAYGGRIESVAATYTPATWLKYQELRAQLTRLYGDGRSTTSLPRYADDAISIENTISLGRGRMGERWQQDGWTISLSWSHRKSILLLYTHQATYDAWRNANPNPSGL